MEKYVVYISPWWLYGVNMNGRLKSFVGITSEDQEQEGKQYSRCAVLLV